jgi:hypothetical protein
MVTIGRYDNDRDCWGISHNLYHRTLLSGYEYIDIQFGSSNPPTLGANSAFQIYKDKQIKVSDDSFGNNVFPPGSTSITNYEGHAVFCSSNISFTWASTNCDGSTAGNYYMYCTGADDVGTTSIGQPLIRFGTTKTFTIDFAKGGVPYSTNNERALAAFTFDGNSITNCCIFRKSFKTSITEVSTAYTANGYDNIIIAKTSSITLPSVTGNYGFVLNIKRVFSTNVIIYGSVDGSTSVSLATNYDSYQLVCGSTAWYII